MEKNKKKQKYFFFVLLISKASVSASLLSNFRGISSSLVLQNQESVPERDNLERVHLECVHPILCFSVVFFLTIEAPRSCANKSSKDAV